MLPMNQLPMLSQDEYNDFIEFQNFKKLKYAQQQLKAGIPPSGLNLSAANSSAAAAAAFNFFNNPNGNSAMNSIFPMTSSASIPTTSMSMSMLAANQSFLNQQHQQQQQQSQQIIPKVVPNGIPLQLMRQPSAASFMPYKNVPNFPGLKGGASNFTPSPNMFATIPPSMPIQTLTPKVANPNTNTPQQQLTPTTPQAITMISPPPPTTTTLISPQIHKRRAPSPEIIVDDRPEADMQIISEKKAKLQKIMPESYTTKTDSCFPKLSLQSATGNSSYQQITSSSISSLPSIDNSLKITPSSTISLPSTTSPSTSSISSTSTTTVSRDIISPPLQSSITKSTTSLQTPIPTPLFPQSQSHSTPTAASESFMDAEETHIIITARPRVPDSAEREETYTTEDDSDYDTNLRPKETPLQYKERMMVRVMDKAKRKNEASKRSREKRKREHQDRQMEKQRLERRNMELTEKLMNLKEALKRLRPQICISCNEQVQKFLDQCQNSKEGMNVFVLRPCKQDKCPGNKSVGREIGKFARGQ